MTREDLKSYRAVWVEPVRTPYGGYDVFAYGLPALGGVDVVEALHLIELAGVREQGHYTESAYSLYWMMQATRTVRGTSGNEWSWA